MISITKKTGTANTTYSKGRSIKYIVVHYTAGTSSASGKAANTAAYFAKSSTGASADFIVDDANIVQYNPDIKNRYCWAVGGSKQNTKGGSLYGVAKNANCINVEICSTNSTGKVKSANDSTWSFTAAVLNNATDLVKYLMETYSIDADHVIRHYDCTGKCCPGVYGWNADSGSESKWKSFKAGLTSSSTTSTTTSSSGFYLVKVTNVPLDIRKGAGTSYDVVGQITTAGTFTIVEESNGWGLLKSYQTNRNGWINLDEISASTSSTSSSSTTTTSEVPYVVRVSTVPLNIRKGPGTDYDVAAKITSKGSFTIVEESTGTGSNSGWGLLKSYQKNRNGWISLDYATKV